MKKLFYFLMVSIMIGGIFSAVPLPVFAAGNDIGGGASQSGDSVDFVPGEVLAAADSYEQAVEYANTYGAKLKSYAYGIAVLTVDNAQQAVAESQTMSVQGLPKLSLNMRYQTYEAVLTAPDKSGTADYTAYADYTGPQYHHGEIYSDKAWDISTGAGVTIAVIDTGIDLTHPKFTGKVLANSYNSHTNQIGLNYVQDDYGHGTHVSGIAAALMSGDTSVCGVAPDAKILMIKANDPATPNSFQTDSLLRGINYAVENGADIINMSLGRNYMWGPDLLEQSTIANAVAKGVTVICAAGNDSNNHAGYPAAYPEAIAVSATKQGSLFDSSYSNYGPEVDISAPGTYIYSTRNGGGYVYMSGTSMASPVVAGVAALVKSLRPDYNPDQIRTALCQTARKVTDMTGVPDLCYGYGIVNAYDAVLYSEPSKAETPSANPPSGQVEPGTAVALSTATPGASIYYTTDGSNPTASSKLYINPILINSNVTIKAIAVKDGFVNSDIASFPYTVIPPGFTISVKSVSGIRGGEVTVPITVKGNPGIAGYALNLTYDGNALQFVSVNKGDLTSPSTWQDTQPDTLHRLRVIWVSTSDVTGDGVLYSVTFKISPGAPDVIPLTLSYYPGDISNKARDELSPNVVSGQIITKIVYGDINDDKVIDIRDLIMLNRHIAHDITLEGKALLAADVQYDGVINIDDASLLAQYILGFDVKLGV